jgi:nicotinate-nucleotide--dimethylbenzimidazole phosphoribosyltransferase
MALSRDELLVPESVEAFAEDARRAVYDAIALRRDVRHFRPEVEVPEDVLLRILGAAHQAPSVGFSQPWGFVVVRDRVSRERIRDSFLACRRAEAARFPPERREQYLAHKLEGILEAPLNICVAVDLRPRPEAILGTTVQPEAVRASACCAVQNLWLAARVEGIGVGWVSIVEPAILRRELQLPAGVEPIAFLCVGAPRAFRSRPMLEETGWESRRVLASVLHRERWADRAPVAVVPPAAPAIESRSIPPFDMAARAAAEAHQLLLTKPPGSLGRLEELAAWYAGARGLFPPPAPARCSLALFAGDHGVVSEGVSAYGSPVTAAMVANVMAGGAAVNTIAGRSGSELTLVDVGISGDLSALPRDPLVPLTAAKVRAGTGNIRQEPAMTRDEANAALEVGAGIARTLVSRGADLLASGEIGIGNTTAAAALVCVFTGLSPSEIVGRGTGLDDAGVAHKQAVVADALALHHPDPADPVGVLASVGGLELAAIAGFLLEGARLRRPLVVDGFLGGAAALVARAIDSAVTPYLLASHLSSERGATHMLRVLGLTPVLDLGLRLGEGTGALLAAELVRTAVELQLSMATFATAGVVGRPGTDLPERSHE